MLIVDPRREAGIIYAAQHGAVGDDAHDDTAELTAAIAAAGALTVGPSSIGGAIVELDKGRYRVSTISLPTGVTLRGKGAAESLIHSTQPLTRKGAVRLAFDASQTNQHARLEALGIYADEGHGVFADPDDAAWSYVYAFDGAAYTDRSAVSLEPYPTPWPAFADVGDYVYCGQSAHAPHGSYNCLRGLLGCRPKGCTFELEYWNGGAWAALPNADLRNGLRHRYWYFASPADWEACAVNGQPAYWIRLRSSTAPTSPVTACSFYKLAGNLLNFTLRNVRISAGKEAIYLDRAYAQASKLDDLFIAYAGGGCLSIVGNANVLGRFDEEGGSRSVGAGDASDYRVPLAQFVLAGMGNSVRSNVLEGLANGAPKFYASGDNFEFAGGWYEGGAAIAGNVWGIWEGIRGGSFDALVGSTYGGAVITQSFFDCQIDVGRFASGDQSHYLGEYLALDPDDATSSIRIGLAYGNFISGQGDEPRVFIDRFVSTIGTAFGTSWGAGASLTGNLLANGNFALGSYGWTIVAEAGVSYSATQESAADGRGRRLKFAWTGGGPSARALTVYQPVPLATGHAHARGFFSYRASVSGGGEFVYGLCNWVDVGAREQDTWSSHPIADVGAGPCNVGWYLYSDASGEGTAYLEDAQLVLGGGRAARVPLGDGQRQWVSGRIEVEAPTPPGDGDWPSGSIVWNSSPSVAAAIGWVKVGSAWCDFGTISAFFQNVTNCSTAGSNLTKTGGGSAWNAGASTLRTIAGDGYVEFSTAEVNKYKAAGLSATDPDATLNSIAFAIYFDDSGTWSVYESGGNPWGTATVRDVADVFRIKRTGTQIEYQRNGVTFYTSLVASAGPLRFDSSLYSPGSTITGVTLVG